MALLAVVVLPTATATIFFGFIASPVFVSESRFVVRVAEAPDQSSGIGGIFKGFTAPNQTDLLLVREYLLSRQAAAELDRGLALRKTFGAADLFSRFPRPFEKASLESFYDYYRDKVRVATDPESSVAILTTRGFSARFVTELNAGLLRKASRRVAELNAQIRADALTQSDTELQRAAAQVSDAERSITAYRRANTVIDPEKQAAVELQGRQEISNKLVSAESQLAQVRRIAPRSSQIPALEAQVQTLRNSADELQATVSGGASSSRAATSERFRALEVRREIATKILAAATEARLRARADAERRHLYLEVLSAPSYPDEALLPRRSRSVLAVLLFSLLCSGVLALLWAGAREHRSQK